MDRVRVASDRRRWPTANPRVLDSERSAAPAWHCRRKVGICRACSAQAAGRPPAGAPGAADPPPSPPRELDGGGVVDLGTPALAPLSNPCPNWSRRPAKGAFARLPTPAAARVPAPPRRRQRARSVSSAPSASNPGGSAAGDCAGPARARAKQRAAAARNGHGQAADAADHHRAGHHVLAVRRSVSRSAPRWATQPPAPLR